MKEVIHSMLAPKAIGPYSQAIATSDLVLSLGNWALMQAPANLKARIFILKPRNQWKISKRF